jgi:hypothetical protein
MKDLLVYVADADALGFINALLQRPPALGIRALSYDIQRHPQRDAGMVLSGAELVRMQKGRYQKALLIWDYQGCGRDHKQTPAEVAAEIQDKLDRFTWIDNSAVTLLVPELEQWLWFCETAVATHCRISPEELRQWIQQRADRFGLDMAALKANQPKEVFEHIMRDRLKRTISPRDFEEIGKRASVNALMDCDSFHAIVDVLRIWFPQQ